LTIQVGRWPSRSWKDTPKTQLELRLGEVAGGIVTLAQEIHAKEQEEERRKEAHRLAVAHYEFLTKRRANEIRRFEQLETQVSNWERAVKLRTYADLVEQQAKAQGQINAELEGWLAWVRAKADWLDPLVLVSDPILDAPEPKRPPGYW
jgi:thioredoxin-like negative regulator of GroEL